jgi:hypothetical protein
MQSSPSQKASAQPRYDFSHVRVHDDARAVESARAVNALAYTVSRDIVFGMNQDNSRSHGGKRLLAHELAHVVQQEYGANLIQRQVSSSPDECGERGPADSEDHPLIYNCQDANNLGRPEQERCKRPAVGHAQQLLNEFLRRYDNWKSGVYGDTIACAGGGSAQIETLRNSLPLQLKVDCWFGDLTCRATRMFQLCDGGLKVDGKIGEKTWPRLEDIAGGQPPQGQPPQGQPPQGQPPQGQPPQGQPPQGQPPYVVFMCSKELERSPVGTHAFFRVGGRNIGNPTYSLEPVDQPLFDPADLDGTHPWGSGCLQGIPMRDFPEDVKADSQCEMTSIDLPCLEREFASYPIGLYCTLGPNSNTFVGHVARNCGINHPNPPGWNPGIDDNPPSSGTFAPSTDYTLVAGCVEKLCGRGL